MANAHIFSNVSQSEIWCIVCNPSKHFLVTSCIHLFQPLPIKHVNLANRIKLPLPLVQQFTPLTRTSTIEHWQHLFGVFEWNVRDEEKCILERGRDKLIILCKCSSKDVEALGSGINDHNERIRSCVVYLDGNRYGLCMQGKLSYVARINIPQLTSSMKRRSNE